MSQFIEMFTNNNFEMVPLGDLCDKISDGSHNPPKGIENSKYLMISSKNVFKDHLDLTDVRYLTEEDFEVENKRTNVKANDVLLTIVGTIGRTYLVKGDEGNLVMQRSVAVLTPNSRVTPLFLMFYLHSDKNLEKEGRGNAQKGIYLKQLSQYEIKVPSIDLQKQFEAIYRQADKSGFDGLKSQFIEMFNDKGYPIAMIKSFADVSTGSTPSKAHPEYWNGGNPWVSAEDMKSKYVYDTCEKVTDVGYATCKIIPVDTLMYVCRGSIGVMAINKIECATNQSICRATCHDNVCNVEYLYHALMYQKDSIKKMGTGTSFKSLNQTSFSELEIKLPPYDEQMKFVTIAEQADKSGFELRKSIDAIDAVIKSLINS